MTDHIMKCGSEGPTDARSYSLLKSQIGLTSIEIASLPSQLSSASCRHISEIILFHPMVRMATPTKTGWLNHLKFVL
jgi:hypothetical protein